jgi:hypothetical protein
MSKITLPTEITIDDNNNNKNTVEEQQPMTTELMSLPGVSSSFLMPTEET